jgi:signal transduction histidine kinase/DNA-binding response OmpR family regulator
VIQRLSIARSIRLALLGATLALTALAAVGLAELYSARQRYEDRLASAYALDAAGGRLLAASVVEEATLALARGPSGAGRRQQAAQAFDYAAGQATRLASPDPPSARLVAAAVGAEAALRSQRHHPRPGAALQARAPIDALSARQAARRSQAHRAVDRDSRRALLAIVIGGALALLTMLALVGSLLRRVRGPLENLVTAARRLASGHLETRVDTGGPQELGILADAFNSMAADLEQALGRVESERRRLETTIESLGDALVVADGDDTVLAANPRATELLPQLAPGSRIASVSPGWPSVSEALGGEVTLERDGRTLSVTASRLAGPEPDAAGDGEDGSVVWTARDVTERARLERLKSEFVATASHELRSPLTSIKGFVELLEQSPDELSERQREFIEIIRVSTNRLVDLVNDLLDVALVEAGEIEIHPRPADVGELVHEVGRLLGPRMTEKDQTLVLELPEDRPLALIDPARVRQIVTNLVTNAHLYTGQGGVVRVAVRGEGRSVVLSVSDSGQGMTDEQLAQIFDRFYRATDGGGSGGTGLGLAIVKSLVDLHGGTIDVRSEPGTGSTFEVRLPVVSPPAEEVAPRHALQGKRVLVVDDEPSIGRLIATRLEPFGVESVVVNDGATALNELRTGHFDAMTLDILMPGMSGFEVLRALRTEEDLRRMPVVVVSVFSGREALSGEWVVSKPIDAEELADALGAAVTAGRARLLVVAREPLRERLAATLGEMGIEYAWATTPAAAAALCGQRHFEVALVDAGLNHPDEALDSLRLRGRRLGRSVVVFSAGGPAPGLARLHPEPVSIDDAGAAVLSLLDLEAPDESSPQAVVPDQSRG